MTASRRRSHRVATAARQIDVALRRARDYERAHRPIDAERELRRALPLLRRTTRVRTLARELGRLGRVLLEQGRYRESSAILRTAIRHATAACGEDSLAVATSLNDFGVCCKYLARYAEAGQSYQRALDIFERRVGHGDPRVATVYHNLGGLEHAAGNWLRGEPFAREAVRIRTRALGRSHPDVAADLTALAALLDQQKRYRQAESLYRRAMAIQTRANGPDHTTLFASLNNLAAVCQATRRPRAAETLYRRALEIGTATAGGHHPKIAYCRNNLAALLLARGRIEEAEVQSRQALATFRRQLGRRHPTTARCLEAYAAILKRQGRARTAVRLARTAAHILEAVDALNDEGMAVTATINPLRARYRLMVDRSPAHRFGVFTQEPIPAGHQVIEYTGEKIARVEATRRWDPARSYVFELDSYWRLDGAVGGCGAEYINHSCAPNLVTRQRGHRIFYFSKRRIAKGEELTVDYKYAPDPPPIPCRCGAPTCRGTMNLPRQAE